METECVWPKRTHSPSAALLARSGGKAMAIAFTLIETAKLNNVDPQAWLT